MPNDLQDKLNAATLVAKDAEEWRDKTKHSGSKLVLNALVGLLQWYKSGLQFYASQTTDKDGKGNKNDQ